MLPMFLIMHVVPNLHHRGIRLWVPLFLIWILLLPFVLILLPVVFVICVVVDVDPFTAIAVAFAVLRSLNGTVVEVDNPDASVFIQVC